jgi:hypothetical protein
MCSASSRSCEKSSPPAFAVSRFVDAFFHFDQAIAKVLAIIMPYLLLLRFHQTGSSAYVPAVYDWFDDAPSEFKKPMLVKLSIPKNPQKCTHDVLGWQSSTYVGRCHPQRKITALRRRIAVSKRLGG